MLRRAGLWLTGRKHLGMKDANDANSAQKHGMHYMGFNLKHIPTMNAYFGGIGM